MIQVVKASGDVEPFSEEKLRRSLTRSGASDDEIHRVLKAIHAHLHKTMTTKELYRLAYKVLRKKEPSVAARYALKKALLALGPTGYPFEKFMAAVMKSQGYSTETGVVLEGKHISHEVDVVAERAGHRVLMECKYHGAAGRKSDLKVALYVYARALDLLGSVPNKSSEFWLVTNTKFTSDAIKYGSGAGLRLYSWDQPEGHSLAQLIEEAGVQPVTCLTSLKKRQKQKLVDIGVVLSRELYEDPSILADIGLRGSEMKQVRAEITGLPHASIPPPPPSI